MRLDMIRTMSMKELLNQLESVSTQQERNIIIYELTYRMYVPFTGVSFDELLLCNGYKPIEKDKPKVKTYEN